MATDAAEYRRRFDRRAGDVQFTLGTEDRTIATVWEVLRPQPMKTLDHRWISEHGSENRHAFDALDVLNVAADCADVGRS